jgi:hypothetical protein
VAAEAVAVYPACVPVNNVVDGGDVDPHSIALCYIPYRTWCCAEADRSKMRAMPPSARKTSESMNAAKQNRRMGSKVIERQMHAALREALAVVKPEWGAECGYFLYACPARSSEIFASLDPNHFTPIGTERSNRLTWRSPHQSSTLAQVGFPSHRRWA